MTKQKKHIFEKRHFEAIAKILGGAKSAKFTRKINGDLRADGYYHGVNHTIDLFINYFNSDNPNFDSIRFRNEVGGADKFASSEPSTFITEIQ